MDFSFSAEQHRLVKRAREFGRTYLTEDNIRLWCNDQGIPDEVSRAYLDAGLGYVGIPEKLGGTSDSITQQGLIIEELTRIAGASLPFQSQAITLELVGEMGNADQVALANKLFQSTGSTGFSLAMSEPTAGSDTFGLKTTVTEQDGELYLDGRKTFVVNGEFLPYLLVVARDGDISESDNLSLWLIPLGSEGVSTIHMTKVGQEMNPFCMVDFNHVHVDPSQLVGSRGEGSKRLLRCFEMGRCIVCAASVGLARAALADAARYAQQRTSFGKPISDYQQVGAMLTDMEVKVRTMRLLLYQTLNEFDAGKPGSRLSTALLKRYVPRAATEVASDALQIFGGIGYTDVTRVSRIWRDCRGNQIAEGTDEVMVRIATKRVIGQYLADDPSIDL